MGLFAVSLPKLLNPVDERQWCRSRTLDQIIHFFVDSQCSSILDSDELSYYAVLVKQTLLLCSDNIKIFPQEQSRKWIEVHGQWSPDSSGVHPLE